MPVPFIMPKFDMDQEKATLVSWLKKEGERVEMDEPVLVVETEKVAIDVTAPASGILAGICAREGDVVPVTQVIAYILKDGERLELISTSEEPQALSASNGGPEPRPAAAAVSASPVAQRMAQDLGVDLGQVPAAGPRITRADVERYVSAASAAPAPAAAPQSAPTPADRPSATPAARRLAREQNVDLAALPGSGPQGRIQAADVQALLKQKQKAAGRPERPAEVQPLEGMRRVIAERMQASFQEAPHIALSVEVDVTQLEAARRRLNALAERRGGRKVSLTALLVKISAWALEQEPALNASLIDQHIYRWKDINIGVAVGLPNGLIVPVIHHANRKGVQEIAAVLEDLTGRARAGKLALADVQQGTFTISNLGMYGIRQFRPIINPPEGGILAVGAVVRRPVVINEQDELAVRPMMDLTLAADHRLVDGLAAARFLAGLVGTVEQPDLLLY